MSTDFSRRGSNDTQQSIPANLFNSPCVGRRTSSVKGEGNYCLAQIGEPVEEKIPRRLIDQRDVENEYDISVYTQEKLRRENKFAPWLKVGRKVYYKRVELEFWLDEQQAKIMSGRSGDDNAAS